MFKAFKFERRRYILNLFFDTGKIEIYLLKKITPQKNFKDIMRSPAALK